MLCKIYRTTFELNHNKKLRRVIASLSDGPYRYDDYYYYKPNVLEPIMEPYNFHFNEWELIIWNFNPELTEHWTYFTCSVSRGPMSVKDLDFLNEWSAEWMPKDAKKRLATVYGDKPVDIPRCWKDRTKQNTQYNSNLKARRKKCRGYYQ